MFTTSSALLQISLHPVPSGPIDNSIYISSGNGQVNNSWQAITWTNN